MRILLLVGLTLCMGDIVKANLNPKIDFIDIQTNRSVTEALVGKALAIQVSGLPPEIPVTITCDNLISCSSATFLSDSQGHIDLSQQAPLSGSYSGIDIDGLFWSRTIKNPPSSSSHPGPFICRAFVGNKEVAKQSLEKIYQLPGITSQRLKRSDSGFEAVFSVPAGEGPFPALFLVGGSEGGLDEFHSNYFASLGYATLSVAYHGMPGLPDELSRIPLEYFKNAMEWLKAQKKVDTPRIGLFGTSRGGELALLLASTYPQDFAATIANEPSGVVWAGFTSKEGTHSSWIFSGQDIPAVPYADEPPHKETSPDGREIVTYTNLYLTSLKNKNAVEQAIIPVEKFQGPLLILAGDADQIWPSCVLSEFAIQRRKLFGLDSKDSYYCFPNAGHTIGIPGASLMDLVFYHPLAKEFWHAGGTPEGNAKAQRIGWDAVVRFLNDNLK